MIGFKKGYRVPNRGVAGPKILNSEVAGGDEMSISKRSETRQRSGAPRRRLGRQSGGSVRTLVGELDRLYAEVRDNPESEAAEMIRLYALTGMLGSRRKPVRTSAGSGFGALQEASVREKLSRLEKVTETAAEAQAAAASGKLDAAAICSRIADLVGLRPLASEPYQSPPWPPDPAVTEPTEQQAPRPGDEVDDEGLSSHPTKEEGHENE